MTAVAFACWKLSGSKELSVVMVTNKPKMQSNPIAVPAQQGPLVQRVGLSRLHSGGSV